MHPIIRNILAIVAGIVIGSTVNMGIISISGSIIPPPEGTDVTTSEGLKAAMHLFEPKHFIFPFLAHALGTFFGAFVAAMVATRHRTRFAFTIIVSTLLANIVGALSGGLVAGLTSSNHKIKFALGIGIFFLTGGIASVFMLPSPIWYSVVDLLCAYIPMAYLAGKLASRKNITETTATIA